MPANWDKPKKKVWIQNPLIHYMEVKAKFFMQQIGGTAFPGALYRVSYIISPTIYPQQSHKPVGYFPQKLVNHVTHSSSNYFDMHMICWQKRCKNYCLYCLLYPVKGLVAGSTNWLDIVPTSTLIFCYGRMSPSQKLDFWVVCR